MNNHYKETILQNGDYYDSLLKDIHNAKHTIDIETYIFNEDNVGIKIGEALAQVAERGVKVRVLVDGAGTPGWGGQLTRKMEQAGVLTQVFHPFPWKIFSWVRSYSSASFLYKIIHLLSNINKRNHRKSCIIDNAIVYVGSANISKCHSRKDQGGDDWRDTTVKLDSVETKDIQHAFNKAWDYFSIQERIQKSIKDAFRDVDQNSIFRLNYSRHQRHILQKDILKRISLSQNRIWVTNAYFIPDASLLKAITQASERSIEVRILLPSKSDVFIMPLMATTFYMNLLKKGVKIFEYLPSVLHAKILIIDDWYCTGSSNLNYRSLIHDLEVDVHIQSDESKRILEKQFLEDINQSKQVDLAGLKKLSLFKRIVGRLLLYVKYFF